MIPVRHVITTSAGLLLFVLIGLNTIDSFAQSPSGERERECVSHINQRTAALVADDWREVERLAKRYLETCKEVHESEHLACAYEQIAIANRRLNDPKSALTATETCIALFYSNSGCHLEKAEAMLKLGHIRGARSALDIAEKLVPHLIRSVEQDMERANHRSARELYAAKLRELRAQQRVIEAMRPKVSQRHDVGSRDWDG
jgi:hypothetical protein